MTIHHCTGHAPDNHPRTDHDNYARGNYLGGDQVDGDPSDGDPSDWADPALTPLSRQQATLLVHIGLDVASRLGLDVTYEGGAALVPVASSASGPVLGLTNLARTLSRYQEECWPDLIENHFRHLLDSVRHGPPAPPTDPEQELIQRLVPRHALPPDWTADRPDFVPGLLSVPATEDNGIVAMFLNPSDLGLTWSAAEHIGLTNLRSRTDDVEWVDHDDIRIAFVTGSSFAASRALVLDTVLHESLHLDHLTHGALVALPARELLLIHVIKDLSVIPALGQLLNLAARSYDHDPGPLSPDVHLVIPDPTFPAALTWHASTTTSPDHTPLRLSPHLEALTHHLATQEPSRE
ncbi:hypothetical protein [Kribbella sp. NPDC055071]